MAPVQNLSLSTKNAFQVFSGALRTSHFPVAAKTAAGQRTGPRYETHQRPCGTTLTTRKHYVTTTHKIIEAYQALEPVRMIAKREGCSRQTIYKILWQNGVVTSKHRIQVKCAYCGVAFPRTKARVRRQKAHFCRRRCFIEWMDATRGSLYLRRGAQDRMARRIIATYFPGIKPEHLIYYLNGDRCDRRPANMEVYALDGIVRKHRGEHVEPLWRVRQNETCF